MSELFLGLIYLVVALIILILAILNRNYLRLSRFQKESDLSAKAIVTLLEEKKEILAQILDIVFQYDDVESLMSKLSNFSNLKNNKDKDLELFKIETKVHEIIRKSEYINKNATLLELLELLEKINERLIEARKVHNKFIDKYNKKVKSRIGGFVAKRLKLGIKEYYESEIEKDREEV